MVRCYITDRHAIGGSVDALLLRIEAASRTGVDFIQIRENDLPVQNLLELTRAALQIVRRTSTRILVNDRVDVALMAGAHGVQLKSNGIPPRVWRPLLPPPFLLGCSCHTLAEVQQAGAADFLLFSPIFETPGKGRPVGLEGLGAAVSAAKVPVLALGGVTKENERECLLRGAAGIAAIRMFQT